VSSTLVYIVRYLCSVNNRYQDCLDGHDDAKQALAQWEVKQLYLMVDSQINKVPVYAGAGRPSQRAQPKREYCHITGSLYTALAKRQDALKQLGLFIIASNDLADDLRMGS
jgi:hypothetical protein